MDGCERHLDVFVGVTNNGFIPPGHPKAIGRAGRSRRELLDAHETVDVAESWSTTVSASLVGRLKSRSREPSLIASSILLSEMPPLKISASRLPRWCRSRRSRSWAMSMTATSRPSTPASVQLGEHVLDGDFGCDVGEPLQRA